MKQLLLMLFVAALCLSPSSAFAQDQAPEDLAPTGDAREYVLEAKPDGIARIDADGTERWKLTHRSTLVADGEPDYPIRGPVRHDEAWYYAIRGDLMTVDPETGRVTDYYRYPALIEQVASTEAGLRVTLRGSDWPEDVDVAPIHDPTVALGRGAWSDFGLVALRTRTDIPEDITNEDDVATHKGDWSDVRSQLIELEKGDRKNALIPGYIGLTLTLDGKPKAAEAAFDRALAVDGFWSDHLLLCGLFERAKDIARADEACERGLAKMKARGIRNHAVPSLIVQVIVTPDLRQAMQEAIANDDVERAERIAQRFHTMFPNAEASHHAWRQFSEWLAQEGAAERAKVWLEHARAAEQSKLSQSFWGQTTTMDRMILLLFAIFLMVPFAGFAAGLRRRRNNMDGWKKWLPRPTLAEIALAGVLLISAVPLTFVSMKATVLVGLWAEAPLGIMQDGYGSPDVVQWLDTSLKPGEARDDVLAYARHELQAVQEGKAVTMEPPPVSALVEALEEHADVRARYLLADLSPSFRGFSSEMVTSFPNPIPLGIPALFTFLICGIVGNAFRRLSDKIADALQWAVPGSATSLTPLVLTVFLAGVIYLATPIGTILRQIALPAFGKYFGMGSLGVGAIQLPAIETTLAWVAVVGALLVHVVTMVLARRDADS